MCPTANRDARRAAAPALLLSTLLTLAACASPREAASSPAHASSGVASTPDPGRGGAAPSTPYPTTARAVAAQLRRAERTIADRSVSGHELRRAAHLEQLALRSWSDHRDWDRRVLDRLPRARRADARDGVTARRLFRSMHPSAPADLATELPAWRIVRPWSRGRLLRAYHEGQRRYGVDWTVLAAVNMTETDFGRIVGLSTAGAQGPMQFMPATWAAYGHGDVHDPHDAVLGAAHYLAANGFRSSPARALWHYNQSWAYVRAVRLLADVMRRHPRAYAGFHTWQVYYLTRYGSVRLPTGYAERHPVPVRRWVREHHGTVLP